VFGWRDRTLTTQGRCRQVRMMSADGAGGSGGRLCRRPPTSPNVSTLTDCRCRQLRMLRAPSARRSLSNDGHDTPTADPAVVYVHEGSQEAVVRRCTFSVEYLSS